MPGFIETRLNRHQFLGASAALIGGMMLRIKLHASDGAQKTNRFALLSDTHIDGKPVDPYRESEDHLRTVVEQILQSSFDMALINGDAAVRDGQQHDYQLLARVLEPLKDHCPVAIGLGNHDDRAQFRKVFEPEETAAQKECQRHVLVIETEHVNWLILDSLLYVNKGAGFLGKPQRTWLQRYLTETTDKPVLIMVHHTLGESEGDLLDAGYFLEIVKAAPTAKAVFYGHSHQYSIRRDGNLHLINLPAVGYNFTPNDPVGWVEAEVRSDGIQLRLRAIDGNRAQDGEVTELSWN